MKQALGCRRLQSLAQPDWDMFSPGVPKPISTERSFRSWPAFRSEETRSRGRGKMTFSPPRAGQGDALGQHVVDEIASQLEYLTTLSLARLSRTRTGRG